MEIQISIFDMMPREQTRLEKCLMRGSGFAGGVVRIIAAAENYQRDRFAEYLRKEFGIGGHSIDGGFADYDGKGYSIRMWRQEQVDRVNWLKVADVYYQLIASGQLPKEEKDIRELERIRNKYGRLPEPTPRCHYPYLEQHYDDLKAWEKEGHPERTVLI